MSNNIPHIRNITGPEAAILLGEAPCTAVAEDRNIERSYVVDVRDPAEYEERHIAGAILLPLDTIEETAPSALPDKNAIIIVYCHSGHRAPVAAEILEGMGYTRLRVLGAMSNWTGATAIGSSASL